MHPQPDHSSDDLSYVIASVYSGKDDTIDQMMHTLAISIFKSHNVPFKVVEGGYLNNNSEYVVEQSIVFPHKYWDTLSFVFRGQESILILGAREYSSPGRNVTLYEVDHNNELCNLVSLGYFVEVPREVALANKAGYTRDQQTYYIAKSDD